MNTRIFSDSGSQPSVILPPGDIWQCLQTSLLFVRMCRGGGGEVLLASSCRGARAAGEYPNILQQDVPSPTLLPQIENYPTPKVNRMRHFAPCVRSLVHCYRQWKRKQRGTSLPLVSIQSW